MKEPGVKKEKINARGMFTGNTNAVQHRQAKLAPDNRQYMGQFPTKRGDNAHQGIDILQGWFHQHEATPVWLTVRCGKASVETDGSPDIRNVGCWLTEKLLKD
jgi:hypothetical protein